VQLATTESMILVSSFFMGFMEYVRSEKQACNEPHIWHRRKCAESSFDFDMTSDDRMTN
jgi:hypothetical protein